MVQGGGSFVNKTDEELVQLALKEKENYNRHLSKFIRV